MNFINFIFFTKEDLYLLPSLFFLGIFVLSILGVINLSETDKKRLLLCAFVFYLAFLLVYFGFIHPR